ncbi:MerR family transcriptional regulator [Leucobacter sp. G161]|uniref:MerR family transcriptional regulator n=1 Tax=Leucobacter sp. G161 TaxID=663704 RepID=UPI00073CC5EE|nr:MerR family transcriptional regulator [Leucobacter sp. G161]KUF05718.1 hypothetical protein AUL38_15765 [Leucobacter sp. G161]
MRISEAARRSGVSARMLRHYDKLGLVSPTQRSSAGYREYAEDDLRRLLKVEALRALGLTLRQAGDALAETGADPEDLIADLITASTQRLDQERRLLARLERFDAADPASWDEALETVRLARGLSSPVAGERQRAALGLGAGPSAPPSALLAALLDEPEVNATGALRWAFLRTVDGPEALVPELAGSNPARRARALAVVAKFDGPDATELIAPLLTDPVLEIREAAALELGRRGAPVAIGALIALVARGARDVEAAQALGSIAEDSGAAGEILAGVSAALASTDTTSAARSRLTQALGELSGEAPLGLLAELKQDADPAVARVAVYLLSVR